MSGALSGAAAVDVVVVGGGPAGSAAAAEIARAGSSVALLDAATDDSAAARPQFRIGEGAAPGVPQLIQEIFGEGTEAFSPDAHVRCPSIVSAWGDAQPAAVDHMLNPLGVAWNLDRARFDADLRVGARRLGADLRSGAKVTMAERGNAGWKVGYTSSPEGTAEIRARALIDASGRGARVARLQGERKRHLDRLVALWAVWRVDVADQDSSTYIEAVRGGWWYSVLLPAHRRMVVYLTDADLLPGTDEQRLALAESAPGLDLIGPVLRKNAAPRIVFGAQLSSARSGWLERFGGPGWLSAGDAAASFDPLSGRGITVALLSGREAGLAAASLAYGRESAGSDVERHDELVAQILVDAVVQRTDAYRAETRWPDEEFWRRRHQLPDLAELPVRAGVQAHV